MAQVLVVGSGGREHALAWKLAMSPEVTKVVAAPGNPGIAQEPKCSCVMVDVQDISGLVALAQERRITLVVVGPEVPLAAGIGDAMREVGIACCAPGIEGARLEYDKSYCKELLLEAGVPTAQAQVFSDFDQAKSAIVACETYPVVIKASGLAAGKGVIISHSQAEAIDALHTIMVAKRFGDAGRQVVIEDFIEGEELSYIVLVDGQDFVPFASSQDHKRLLEGDRGPNTGGMGAYSPAPRCTPKIEAVVIERVIRPTLATLAARGITYRGFLYAGLMLDSDNTPWVLEYNCRLGDPETQPLLMRLTSDLYHCLYACATGTLADAAPLTWSDATALGIVLAAPGYPDHTTIGQAISTIPADSDTSKVFHAGTVTKGSELQSSGGRVLCATALAPCVAQAQQYALDSLDSITMQGKQYRRDIGWRAL